MTQMPGVCGWPFCFSRCAHQRPDQVLNAEGLGAFFFFLRFFLISDGFVSGFVSPASCLLSPGSC